MPAVITTADNLLPLCMSSSNSDRCCSGVRTGFNENRLLTTGYQLPHLRCKLILNRLSKRKTESFIFYLPDYGIIDLIFSVPYNYRAISTQHIYVFIAVHVLNPTTPGRIEKDWIFTRHEIIRPPYA